MTDTSVGATLRQLCGVWHDHLQAFAPDGQPLLDDPHGGQPGPFPYENLVYIEFDGTEYRQTNVVLSGRPLHVRSFSAEVSDGVLRFARLGPNDPGHIGVSAGPRTVMFLPAAVDEAWQRYSEPDTITVDGDRRTRTTALYRNGVLVRTLQVHGVRIAATADRVHDLDPRGPGAEVHERISTTQVFARMEGVS